MWFMVTSSIIYVGVLLGLCKSNQVITLSVDVNTDWPQRWYVIATDRVIVLVSEEITLEVPTLTVPEAKSDCFNDGTYFKERPGKHFYIYLFTSGSTGKPKEFRLLFNSDLSAQVGIRRLQRKGPQVFLGHPPVLVIYQWCHFGQHFYMHTPLVQIVIKSTCKISKCWLKQ